MRPSQTSDQRRVALVYVRKSVVRNKSDEVSPARQEALCIAEAELHGWTVEAFRDAEGHRSGGSEKGRPEWLRLKQQLGRPDVAAVVVSDISRAGRSRRDLYNFLAEIERRAIALVDLKYRFDTTTAAGRLMLGMLINVLAWEREVASERMTDAIHFKRGRGKHVGNAPYGTKRDDAGVLVESGDWPACRIVLEAYATGNYSIYSLPAFLNAEGLRFRDRAHQPVPFDRYSVRSIISNVLTYAGYIVRGHGKEMQLPRELSEQGDVVAQCAEFVDAVPGSHAPLISRELATRIISVRLKAMHTPSARPRRVFVLVPVARCAHCGGRLRGVTFEGVARYIHEGKVCVRRKGVWDAPGVEQLVLDELRALKLTAYQRHELRRRIEDKLRAVPENAEVMEKVHQLEQKLARLKTLFIEGDISQEHYQSQKRETLPVLEQAQAQLGARVLDLDTVFAQLDSLADVVAYGSPAQQRRAIGDLFSEICLDFSGAIAKMNPRAWVSVVYKQAQPASVAANLKT